MTDEPGAVQEPLDHADTHMRADTHMEAHADVSGDDHGHAESALGPIDWQAWSYALIAAAAGLLVVVAFWVGLT